MGMGDSPSGRIEDSPLSPPKGSRGGDDMAIRGSCVLDRNWKPESGAGGVQCLRPSIDQRAERVSSLGS